jgi:hypothetical protein
MIIESTTNKTLNFNIHEIQYLLELARIDYQSNWELQVRNSILMRFLKDEYPNLI